MVGFVAFMLRAMLLLAIGGSLFLVGDLLRLSYKEPKTLAGQGYSARIKPGSAYPDPAELHSIVPRLHSSYQAMTADTGLAGSGRRVS
jgi:hypothetical protein